MTSTPETELEPITLRTPQDLLASIPYQLGFRPTESVVLACVSGRQLELVARVDLDDLDPPHGPSVLDALRRAVAQAAPTWCALVVYSARGEAAVASQAAAVRGVVGSGVDLDEWIITPDGYRGLGCVDVTCCPQQGHPLEALESSPARAAHVLAGRYVATSADDAFRIEPAHRDVRGLAGRAARRSVEAMARASDDGARWRAEALGAWRTALRRQSTADLVPDAEPAPALAGRVAAALRDRPVRDAALLTLVPGADGAADATIDPGRSPDVDTARALARVTDPACAVRPDPDLAGRATTVLENVVAHAPRRLWSAPLTLLAFLAWWQGDGPRAAYRIDQALAVDPDHRLALLLGSVLSAGLPPGWIRARVDGTSRDALTSGRSVR